MHILPLHGTLDFHDGLAVVIVALTLLMGSALSTLRQRMARQRGKVEHSGGNSASLEGATQLPAQGQSLLLGQRDGEAGPGGRKRIGGDFGGC